MDYLGIYCDFRTCGLYDFLLQFGTSIWNFAFVCTITANNHHEQTRTTNRMVTILMLFNCLIEHIFSA